MNHGRYFFLTKKDEKSKKMLKITPKNPFYLVKTTGFWSKDS